MKVQECTNKCEWSVVVLLIALQKKETRQMSDVDMCRFIWSCMRDGEELSRIAEIRQENTALGGL